MRCGHPQGNGPYCASCGAPKSALTNDAFDGIAKAGCAWFVLLPALALTIAITAAVWVLVLYALFG